MFKQKAIFFIFPSVLVEVMPVWKLMLLGGLGGEEEALPSPALRLVGGRHMENGEQDFFYILIKKNLLQLDLDFAWMIIGIKKIF